MISSTAAMLLGAAPIDRPERRALGEDSVAEPVAWTRQREGNVSVQALEAAGAGRAADPDVELGTKVALRSMCLVETCCELRVFLGRSSPPFDAAGRLEP